MVKITWIGGYDPETGTTEEERRVLPDTPYSLPREGTPAQVRAGLRQASIAEGYAAEDERTEAGK